MNIVMRDFIKEKISEIAFSEVTDTDLLWTDKVLDSISIVELIVEIEGEFGIKVPMNEVVLENFETVELIEKYIQTKLS